MQTLPHILECMHIFDAPKCIPLHVGYLTPPGAGEYWGDCWYPLYVAYIVCNGFALVFSVAAIAAVLVGPIILVCWDRKTWRQQIAILAIIHSVISLITFVAAFAITGFLTASVSAPPFNCGNLKCEEGGVPCSAYTLKRNGEVYARYNQTSMEFEVGNYTDSGDARASKRKKPSRPRYELLLDSVIVKLNNKTFGDVRKWEIPGADVVCRDYRYLASSSPGRGPAFSGLNDTRGQPTNNTCLVLLDVNFNSSFHSDPQGSARLGWQAFKPNAHTMWCSTNMSSLGPGYLPLTLSTGLSLMASGAQDALLGTFYRDFLDISRGRDVHALVDLKTSQQRCPKFNINTTVSMGGHMRGPTANIPAIQLISEDANAWGINGDANYDFPGKHVFCNSDVQSDNFNQVFGYADSLGWDRAGVLFRPSRSGEYVDSALCQDRAYNASWSRNYPLQGAKLYASLQYQCSSLSRGVLCDYGVDPPLAVTPDGKYLSKRNMPDLPDVVIFGSPQTATSVVWAVIGMLIALGVAIILNVVILMCWPCLEGGPEHASAD